MDGQRSQQQGDLHGSQPTTSPPIVPEIPDCDPMREKCRLELPIRIISVRTHKMFQQIAACLIPAALTLASIRSAAAGQGSSKVQVVRLCICTTTAMQSSERQGTVGNRADLRKFQINDLNVYNVDPHYTAHHFLLRLPSPISYSSSSSSDTVVVPST